MTPEQLATVLHAEPQHASALRSVVGPRVAQRADRLIEDRVYLVQMPLAAGRRREHPARTQHSAYLAHRLIEVRKVVKHVHGNDEIARFCPVWQVGEVPDDESARTGTRHGLAYGSDRRIQTRDADAQFREDANVSAGSATDVEDVADRVEG
jgi:hypothetical protein